MNYADFLRDLLAPLRLYDLSAGIGAAELDAAGGAMDEMFRELLRQEQEACPAAALDYGLTRYEELLPYTPAYLTLDDRRRALIALLRIDDCSFTPADLQNTIAGCGLSAVIRETGTHFTVEVSFPLNRGIPENFPRIRERIEQILPCHLDVQYVFIYSSWQDIESALPTWQELEERVSSWKELEVYLP
ncbi:MAG: DUF2313 domain-containing protein [Eubacteriales bacterium]|nr:DUF2313 domain-containing protein [Eubacteriales bacterium]